MSKYKEILRYDASGFSQRQIANMLKASRNTVSKTLSCAAAYGVYWREVKDFTEAEIEELLFGHKISESIQVKPDFEILAKDFGKPGVTRKLLWEEYVGLVMTNGQIPYQYSQFCKMLNEYLQQNRATMRLDHRPGEKIEVDWAGTKVPIHDPETQSDWYAYLFVAVLPYSQYGYAEVTTDMKQENWINAHINMYQYFGGVAPILVCDNLKTGVIEHPKSGDVVINEAYREMANYYDVAIIPTPVRTPKAKASVEGTVGKLTTHVIAKMRNDPPESISEANFLVRCYLDEWNARHFQKREGSRLEEFLTEEKPMLKPLPREPYEYGIWKEATVQYNYHISVDKQYYSVPYKYIKKRVRVRITKNMVEIYLDHDRIASHRRLHGRSNQYSTDENHMPRNHQKVQEWDGERFRNWAKRIGPSTFEVIDRRLQSFKIEQQGYNGCMSILKLADSYTPERLERCCGAALSLMHSPRYKDIKLLIQSNQGIMSDDADIDIIEDNDHAILRGETYYGRNN